MLSGFIQTRSTARKGRLMTAATNAYYIRKREREELERQAQFDEADYFTRQLKALIDKMCEGDQELQRKTDKGLIDESLKQPTITDEPSEKPAYSFIARKSLFPDPKHCSFFHSTAARIFDSPLTKPDGSAEEVSAKSAFSPTMAMVATVPPNQPNRLDSVFTQASTPGRPPKYGKISSIGLYIKYNPGLDNCSLQKLTRLEITNMHATAENSTAFSFDKIDAQFFTGYSTAIKRCEFISQKQTEQYCIEKFPLSTVRTTDLIGETNRQEFYFGFRKPPPYRDKPSGTEFNSTVHTKGMGASLRREHYQSFRRPPPVRDRAL